MPYAVLEKEIERLDEAQQNTVVLFVRFLLSQKSASAPSKGVVCQRDICDELVRDNHQTEETPLFGALKDKIKFIAPDFDEPLEDFAEYM